MRLLIINLLLLLPLLLPVSCHKKTEPKSRPQPTEHWLDENAEKRNKKKRQEHVEKMHRAAPGTDWRAIERANVLAAQERVINPGHIRPGRPVPEPDSPRLRR